MKVIMSLIGRKGRFTFEYVIGKTSDADQFIELNDLLPQIVSRKLSNAATETSASQATQPETIFKTDPIDGSTYVFVPAGEAKIGQVNPEIDSFSDFPFNLERTEEAIRRALDFAD